MMSAIPAKVGLVGCGSVSEVYLKNASGLAAIEVVACADSLPERAAARARQFDIPRVCSVQELLTDGQIDIVLNLTPPAAHAEITLAALHCGKSAYVEKPLAVRLEEGRRIVETARTRGLRVGCAPDTFLGGAWQTARELVDTGAIGEPVAAAAFMTCHGHENWHPDPEFFYEPGGGPLFDMGPYYLAALINLLGPVRRVTGSARASFPERTITSLPKRGEKIEVRTPTHVVGILDFVGGVIATLTTSFDVWHANLPFIEVYGSGGSLSLPDPNGFGGSVRLRRADDADWQQVPLTRPYLTNVRGLGLAEMAMASAAGRRHRASGEMGLHVLETMHGLLEAGNSGRHVEIASTCERPEPISGPL